MQCKALSGTCLLRLLPHASKHQRQGCTQALLAWGLLSTWGWRWLLGASALPLLLLLLAYPWLPESPYYLAVKGQQAAAGAALQKIVRVNGGKLPPGRLQAGGPHKGSSGKASLPCCEAALYKTAGACEQGAVPAVLAGGPHKGPSGKASLVWPRIRISLLAVEHRSQRSCLAHSLLNPLKAQRSRDVQGPWRWRDSCSPHSWWTACTQALASTRTVAGKLLQGPVRLPFLLLLFIWFANALDYYGLVLLTTTVSHATRDHKQQHGCSCDAGPAALLQK